MCFSTFHAQLHPPWPLGDKNSCPSLHRNFSLHSICDLNKQHGRARPTVLMTQSNRVHHNTYLNIEAQLEWGLSYQELLFTQKLSSKTPFSQRTACLPERTVPLAIPPPCYQPEAGSSPGPSLRSRLLVPRPFTLSASPRAPIDTELFSVL